MTVVEHSAAVKDPRVSRLSWRFRSFYFFKQLRDVKHWTNKDAPVKTPENRFLSTSCSTFPLLPAVLLCSFSLSAASPSLDQCVQKVTEMVHIPASYWSRDLKFSHTNRCVLCGSKSRFTIYQGTLVGMNDWKNVWTERLHRSQSLFKSYEEKVVVTDEYKGKSKLGISCQMENTTNIWCTQLSFSPFNVCCI